MATENEKELIEKEKTKNENKPKRTTTKKTTTKNTTNKTTASKLKKEEKLANIDMQEIEKTVKQELKAKKVIPSEEQKKMNGEVFKNIFIAIAITIFLNFIILGFINIEQSVFIVDLKVFAVILLATTIGIFEYAYKKDSGKLAIFGIEILVLSLCMLAFIYLDIMLNSKFVFIAILTTYAFAIYYTIKSAIIYKKMKKQYIINSAKEIIKK